MACVREGAKFETVSQTIMILPCETCASQSFPIWLRTCLQAAVGQWRFLLHQTVEVIWACTARPAKQQQMVRILDLRAFVMDTSETRVSDSCFSVSVCLLCNQLPGGVGTKSLITDVMSWACALRCIIN